MFSREPDLEVVGEAGDGREAVELCHILRPDLVLMDVSMPGIDGITATRKIKAELPQTGVLMLTAHADQDLLLEAVRAGAAGYVLKGVGPAELVGAVRATLVGESPVDQELVMRLVRRLACEEGKKPPATDRRAPQRSSLTPASLRCSRCSRRARPTARSPGSCT
jgi:DNA-binding NarL/FixJ family response regulator